MSSGRAFFLAVVAISATLAGSVAASNCKMVQIADLPVRLDRNHIIVDGSINGQKIGVMLDSGAEVSLILRAAALRLALVPQGLTGYRMYGIGGETRVEAASVDEFKLGQAVRRNWRVPVAGERDFGEAAFILGEDFFNQVDVEFDLAHNAVRLYEPKDCAGTSLAYWATDGAGEADIEAVSALHPQIVVTVQINGQPVRALLDSGAAVSMLTKAEAARLGVTPESPGVVAVGHSAGLGPKLVDSWLGPFASFAIGNEVIRDTTIRFADLWKDATYASTESRIPRRPLQPLPMLLGADFLRAHRLLVAHSQRKIYFTYVGGPVFQRPAPAPKRDAPRPQGETQPGAGADR